MWKMIPIFLLAGRGMQSSRENPVRGATEVTIEARAGFLHLHAKLGGVRFMFLFLLLFPTLLWAGFAFYPLIAGGGGVESMNREALEDMLESAVACANRA